MSPKFMVWILALLMTIVVATAGCNENDSGDEHDDIIPDNGGADSVDTNGIDNGEPDDLDSGTGDEQGPEEDAQIPVEDQSNDVGGGDAVPDAGDDGDTSVETDTSEPATTHDVLIQSFAYNPLEITIALGDTVRWTNKDQAAHTATSGSTWNNPDGLFDSGSLQRDQSFEFTFNTAGEFTYYCIPHSSMALGTVIVQ